MFRVRIDGEARTAVVPPDIAEQSIVDQRSNVGNGSVSPDIRWRAPRPDEYEAAFQLSRTLQDPGAPPTRDLVSRADPPGRLRSSQALQGSASRALNLPDTSRPWVYNRKPRRAPRPIRLGVLTDISGSQMYVVDVSASLTWVLSTAGRDQGIEVCSLLFGSEVIAVAHPGSDIPGVPEPVTLSLTEQFAQASSALGSYLDLDDGGCQRVVTVFSDGYFTPDEIVARDTQLSRWHRQGVHVVWVSDMAPGNAGDIPGISVYVWTQACPDVRLEVVQTVLDLMERDTDG